jgi:hypothetical protein
MIAYLARHPGLIIALAIVLIRVLLRVLSPRPRQKQDWAEGGLYSVEAEGGRFAVAKILKLDDGGVHIRMYSNRFDARPTDVDPATLYMAALNHNPGEHPGIGHIPISRASFQSLNPLLIKVAAVDAAELAGYNVWLEGSGSYFELPN